MNKLLSATGIVVEYNPFHYGHLYHIEKVKSLSQCDVLIAVMSPHFVQRGEPAILDKWERTEIALKHGVDIVIELPTHLTLQSAEVFAKSAIKLLSMMKVNNIIYGSESLEKPKLSKPNKTLLKQGYSYAKAKNTQDFKPNQILGAYYEKYAQKYKINTQRILRTVDYHDLELHQKISSASAIRKAHFEGQDTTHTTPTNLNEHITTHLEMSYPLIRYQIFTKHKNLKDYLLVDEGIENLFYKLAMKHDNLEDFLEEATSKRYTKSRIQRTLMHILLQTPRDIEEIKEVRILGMTQNGRNYLNQIKKDVPICTSFKNYQFKNLEMKSTQVYVSMNPKKNQLLKKEVGSPIFI